MNKARAQAEKLKYYLIFIFVFTILNTLSVSAGPSRTTYQAKIIKPDGYPLEVSSVNFKFTILDPVGSCILYSETYSSVNMTSTGGLISFALGSGVKTYPTSSTTFEQVFSNITPSLSCDTGGPTDYSPSASDIRKIVMQFHDGTGWQTLPAMSINAVPYAMYANEATKLSGLTSSDFVQLSTVPTCATSEALRYTGASFSCVAVGNSVTSSTVVTALGYTPADGVSVTTLTANVSSVSSTVFSVSSTVTSLQNSVAASFAAITSSQWTTSGTNIFYNTGNVGIGTTSPTGNLHVKGTTAQQSTNSRIESQYTGALDAVAESVYSGPGDSIGFVVGKHVSTSPTFPNNAYIWNYENAPIDFGTNGAQRMRIHANGNVGIGTTTPVTKLDVSGGVRIGAESTTCAPALAGTLRYNGSNVEYCNGTSWQAFGVSGAGLQSFNGSTSGTQSFATGSGGTAPNITTANGVHTLNIPLASTGSVTAGLISNSDYTTFTNKITSSAASIAQVLGYVPADNAASGTYAQKANNLSDLTNIATARTNLGLGTFATANTVDLGSASATGTLDVARLPSFFGDATIAAASNTIILSNSGVTAGTYTKVTVDSKGRVTSGSQIISSDVTTALGYTPANSATIVSSQWSTSGTNIFYNTGNVGIGTSLPTVNLEVYGSIAAGSQSIQATQETVNISLNAYSPTFASAAYAGRTMLYSSGKLDIRSDNSEINFYLNGKSNTGYQHARVVPGGIIVGTYDGTTTTNNSTGTLTGPSMAAGTTDQAGGHLALRGGAGTGSGTGGAILFQTAPSSATGSTVNSWQEKMRITQSGNVGIGTTTPVTKLDVSGGVRIGAESTTCAPALAGTLRYNASNVEYCNGTSWQAFGVSGAGLQSFNGSTSGTQSFATGSGGTAPNIVTANGVHTLNIPLASTGSVTAGLISNSDYTTFSNKITSSAASIAQVLGYVPADNAASGTYAQKANNLSDLTNIVTARTNLGLGTFATASSIDLGSASATGTLAIARLPSFTGDATIAAASNTIILSNSGVTAGTYTKVTVDAKGRVTSGAQIISSDVTTALGYTPANSATIVSSQWSTSGTTINYMTGNVGIGTSAPNSKLDVAGQAWFGVTNKLKLQESGDALSLQGTLATDDNQKKSILLNAWGGSVGVGTLTPEDTTGMASQVPKFAVNGGYTNLNLLRISGSDTGNTIYSAQSALTISTGGGTNQHIILNPNGNVGIGTTAPTAKLHLSAGTSSTAALKFISGTLLTSPQSGTMEYDGTNFYLTDSTNTRRAIAANTNPGTYDNVSNINSLGNITMTPVGSVVVSATTASTNSNTGALVVKGGLGVAGDIYASGTIVTSSNIQGVSVTATSGMISPYIYGSTASGGALTLDSTTHSTKGKILLAPNGGNVGIGTTNPQQKVHVDGAGIIRIQDNDDTSPHGYLEFGVTTAGSWSRKGYIGMPGAAGAELAIAADGAGTPIYLKNTTGIVMTVSGSNVGIGTTNPQAHLHIDRSAATEMLVGPAGASTLALGNRDSTAATLNGGAGAYSAIVGANGELNFGLVGHSTPGTLYQTHMFIGNTGNVGIGTSSPQDYGANYKTLEVRGGLATAGGIFQSSTSDSSVKNRMFIDSSLGYFGTSTNHSVAFQTNGTERVRIDNSGNVGIGTTTPTSKLHLYGGNVNFQLDDGNGIANFQKTSTDLRIATQTALPIWFATNGTERVRVDSAGNVGIGTASPLYPLHVNGNIAMSPVSGGNRYLMLDNTASGTGAMVIQAGAGSSGYGGALNLFAHAHATKPGWVSVGLSAGSSGKFTVNDQGLAGGNDLFTVQANGNVGIGTTAPAGKLEVRLNNSLYNQVVNRQSDLSDAVYLTTNSQPHKTGLFLRGSDNIGAGIISAREDNGTTWRTYLAFHTNNQTGVNTDAIQEKMRITSDGNVGIGTTNPGATLDVVGTVNSSSHISQGTQQAYPLVSWGAAVSSNGAVIIKLPGGFSNYGMINVELDTYEYNTNGATKYYIGGHNWNGAWYNYTNQTIGNSNKKVRLGYKDGQYVIVIGDNTSTWSYGSVKLTKITNGDYYTSTMNLKGTYTITQDASAEAYDWISADLNKSYFGTTNFSGNLNVAGDNYALFGPNSGWGATLRVGGNGGTATAHASIATTNGNMHIDALDAAHNSYINWYRGADFIVGKGDASTALFTVKNSGNVGIGTTTPSYRFQVNKISSAPAMMIGGANAGSPRLQVYGLDADSNAWMGLGTDMGGSVYEHSVYFPTGPSNNGRLTLGDYNGTTYNTRMTVLQNGNVGIGTTSPSERLHVVGNLRVQGSTDCTLGNGAAGTNCSSDARLKENIKPIPYALEKIVSLKGVEFDWNAKSISHGRHDIGVIAQDVEKVFPSAVIDDKNTGYKKVDYAVLVAPLIQAVKELYKLVMDRFEVQDRQIASIVESKADKAQIEILTEKAAKLEAENAALKAYLCSKDPAAAICK